MVLGVAVVSMLFTLNSGGRKMQLILFRICSVMSGSSFRGVGSALELVEWVRGGEKV